MKLQAICSSSFDGLANKLPEGNHVSMKPFKDEAWRNVDTSSVSPDATVSLPPESGTSPPLLVDDAVIFSNIDFLWMRHCLFSFLSSSSAGISIARFTMQLDA
jgi:hypothetical protein